MAVVRPSEAWPERKNASRPGPIGLGLGFGSPNSPSSAASTMASRGPVPRMSSISPIQNRWVSLNRGAESIAAQVSFQRSGCRPAISGRVRRGPGTHTPQRIDKSRLLFVFGRMTGTEPRCDSRIFPSHSSEASTCNGAFVCRGLCRRNRDCPGHEASL
jgi:hypothetical protein